MADPWPLIPEITAEDIEWARRLLGLRDLDQPRLDFLRTCTTHDVSACPGSGKTTLIVAKLAILARKWPHRTRGICVLSHTNAAREEIQKSLRSTVVGQQLLSYPHFIDTIHGFVNRFLALPWLNANGLPSPTVDDNAAIAYRCRIPTKDEYWKVESFLKRRGSSFEQIRLLDRNLAICLTKSAFPSGPDSESHKIAKRAVSESTHAGYFCYNEMFIWAKALLEDYPAVSKWLQCRFPLVMIDEMQDTTRLQAEILEEVFPTTSPINALQRVGDPNQEIFGDESSDSTHGSTFPEPSACMVIPTSYRFGPRIAALASPFAISAVGPNGLQGAGPRVVGDARACDTNAVFIFPDASPQCVLDAYGRHVLTHFSDTALKQGRVAAVGGVHQSASDVTVGHPHFPKTVSHYWCGYCAEVARREAHPRTLVQYVHMAQALARSERNLSPGAEKISAGLVRLARRMGGTCLLNRRSPSHRALTEALTSNDEAAAAYHRLLRAFLINQEPLTPASWEEHQADVLQAASGLIDSGLSREPDDTFLHWAEHDMSLNVSAAPPSMVTGPNIYRVGDDTGRCVDIHLGSVHSVKGQTHLATMLLSTYRYDHSAKKILPWLLGDKMNLCGAGSRDRSRLLLTYVAMTRPSHLSCLAIPRSALGDDVEQPKIIAKLRERGWAVAELINGETVWRL